MMLRLSVEEAKMSISVMMCPLETNKHVQQPTLQRIFLDRVRVTTNVETIAAVEIVWSLEPVQIPDGMQHVKR